MDTILFQTASLLNAVSESIQAYFPALMEHRYILLVIATSIEGFNTTIIAGFLISIGTLSLVPAFIACVIGEIINSSIWYGVGYWAGAKPIDWFVRNSPRKRRILNQIRSYLERYTARVVMLMKLTYSVTVPALILTGSIKYDFRKFTILNIIGSIGWIIMTFSIGMFFGQGYKQYIRYFEGASYLVIFIALSLMIIYAVELFGKRVMDRVFTLADTIRRAREKLVGGLDKFVSPADQDEDGR